jgi:hypothetical protein
MTFLYPSFLWALTVLAIPILIHLFNFRRTTKIFFSNNRFLKQVKEVTTAKRRLKHYLILASRLLMLLFLVFAFAQPVIPAEEQLASGKSIFLYIDNSQSMTAQMENKTRGLDAAIRFAQSIVELFPADTRYKILTNDFSPFSNSYKTKAESADILAQIKASSVSRTMEEIQMRMNQDRNRSRDFFWISDFQKSTMGKFPDRWDSVSRWHLVPISFAPLPNVFMDTAYLQNPFAAGGEKNILVVRVRNEGKSEVDQLNLKLTINNIQAGTASVTIPQHGHAETNFDLTTGLRGFNRAVVSFNDFPVSFDNEFFLALNFASKINVLEIRPSSEQTPVENVFGNKEVFDFASYPVTNVNYSLLSPANLVVVNGLDRLDPSLSLALQQYRNNGGTVLLIPGTKPDVSSLVTLTSNSLLRAIAEPAPPEELDRPDFNNPFFENVFEEKSMSIAMPRASRVLDWGADRSAILKFKNDAPFLSRFEQNGSLYVMATPLKQTFTDFYNHALFVPVMYRIAASSLKNENRLYYTLKEDFISLRLDSVTSDDPIRLKGEEEILPSQRRVTDLVYLDIPKFSIQAGFYDVIASRDTIGLLSFNLDKAESLLDQFDASDVKEQMGNGENISIFEADSPEAFSTEIKERYLGKPLWKYAIMLALLFLLAEVLLIRFLK